MRERLQLQGSPLAGLDTDRIVRVGMVLVCRISKGQRVLRERQSWPSLCLESEAHPGTSGSLCKETKGERLIATIAERLFRTLSIGGRIVPS